MKNIVAIFLSSLLVSTVYSQSANCWKEVLVENANVKVCLQSEWYVNGETSEVGDHSTNAKVKLGKIALDSTQNLENTWKGTYHELSSANSSFTFLSDTVMSLPGHSDLYVNYQKIMINDQPFKFCSGIICLADGCLVYESMIPFDDGKALGFVFQVLSSLRKSN